MPLSAAQLQTLKNDIAADQVLSAYPNNSDGAFAIAAAYNALAAPDFLVWRSDVEPQELFDQINWSLYTPADSVDNTATYTNRLLAIQTKQMNLQNMTVGRSRLDFSRPNIRAGIRDAVIQVPSGAGGTNTSPGGVSGATVLGVCVRKATRAEKLFNTGNATTGTTTAALMGFEGRVSIQEVETARNLP